jgi:transcriptional regulator NrdR family protein
MVSAWMKCPGSGMRPSGVDWWRRRCPKCGKRFHYFPEGLVPAHQKPLKLNPFKARPFKESK